MTHAIILSTYPIEDASFRLRMIPLAEALALQGVSVRHFSLFTSWMFRKRRRNFGLRLAVAITLALRLLWRAGFILFMRKVDVLVIHREAYPFFTPFFESIASKKAERVWLDFDDALYVNRRLREDWRSLFRNASRYSEVLKLADFVSVSSPVLKAWVESNGSQAHLLLTLPPELEPCEWGNEAEPGVLWIGSDSTFDQLASRLDSITFEASRHKRIVRILGGDDVASISWPKTVVSGLWGLDKEAEYLKMPSIGVMPLLDDSWALGKGGYKILQYMQSGMPFVASPVGINVWLATESGAGFLANSEQEWQVSIRKLLENSSLAAKMGKKGRAWLVSYRQHNNWNRLVAEFLGDTGQ